MAIRFDNVADFLSSSTNLLNYNNNYTVMAYVYISVDTNANATFFNLFNSTSNYDLIATGPDGTTLASQVRVGGAFTDAAGTSLTASTWYHICIIRSSVTNLTIYLDGVSDSTNARSVSGRAAISDYRIARFVSGNELPFNGRMYALKMWDTDLSTAECEIERFSVLPKTNLSNLNRFCPMMADAAERVRDYSPNADDWTANGTLTDEAPAPISWGNAVLLNPFVEAGAPPTGRIMSSLAYNGGLAGYGGIAGQGGGLAG